MFLKFFHFSPASHESEFTKLNQINVEIEFRGLRNPWLDTHSYFRAFWSLTPSSGAITLNSLKVKLIWKLSSVTSPLYYSMTFDYIILTNKSSTTQILRGTILTQKCTFLNERYLWSEGRGEEKFQGCTETNPLVIVSFLLSTQFDVTEKNLSNFTIPPI